jgi:hypothetical protein
MVSNQLILTIQKPKIVVLADTEPSTTVIRPFQPEIGG